MGYESSQPNRFKSDFDAHEHAMGMPISYVVTELADLLGANAVAMVGCVAETRAVAQWMSGREPQRPHVLRFALQIANMIATATDREVARAWFNGSNPHLGDRVPLLMLRDEPLHEIQGPLLQAARVFADRENREEAS